MVSLVCFKSLFCCFHTSRKTKKQIRHEINQVFQKEYSVEQHTILQRRLSCLIPKSLKSSSYSKEKLAAAVDEIKSNLLLWEPPIKIAFKEELKSEIKELCQHLFHGQCDYRKLAKFSVLKALFVKNEALLAEARQCCQGMFDDIFLEMDAIPGAQYPALEALVGNILVFLVYFGLEDGETIKIPQLINDEWRMVSYQVQKIPLTPKWMGSPMMAFGLVPGDAAAPPLLLMKGTTYPSDEGFVLSLLSDINIGASPGAYAFHLAKNKIHQWLKANTKSEKAKVFGQSLGGTLTLHISAHFAKYLQAAFAYSPTALLPFEGREWEKRVSRQAVLPNVKIFYQENDLVPLAGFSWKKEWDLYQVSAKKKYNFLSAHAQSFLSHDVHLMIQGDHRRERKKASRIVVASIHLILSVPLFMVAVQVYALFLLVKTTIKLVGKLVDDIKKRMG
ncbi:MAG: hypothetical protein ACSNEK_09350 [Parachlamydiaceae bacterium]